MHDDCIFCKIADHEMPADLIFEDEFAAAFYDINPAAPIHILVIPKKHIANLLEVNAQDRRIVTHIMSEIVPKIVREQNLAERGFRLVVNTKEDGGQTVGHLHFHLLGARAMSWPPG